MGTRRAISRRTICPASMSHDEAFGGCFLVNALLHDGLNKIEHQLSQYSVRIIFNPGKWHDREKQKYLE